MENNNQRKNIHYNIIEVLTLNKIEYVLGKHETEEKYVTWRYFNSAYYFGHYIDDYAKAKIDLYTRFIDEMKYYETELNHAIEHYEKENANE